MTINEAINHPEATLVDVRTPGEVAMEPVPGAINIPLDEVPTRWEEFQAMPRPLVAFCRSGYRSDFREEVAKLDPNVPVYVYCRSGNRSGQAAKMMKSMGFKTVYNLEGGMGAWARKQPVEK